MMPSQWRNKPSILLASYGDRVESDFTRARATSLRADVENLLDIERIGAAGNGIELIFSQFTLEVCRVLIVLRRC